VTVQLAEAGRDWIEVIRDPATPVFLAHDSSLLATMLMGGAAMFLISGPEDPDWAPGYRIAPDCIHFRPEYAAPLVAARSMWTVGSSRLSRPSTITARWGNRLSGGMVGLDAESECGGLIVGYDDQEGE
jgi:hypothetical protein